MKKIVYFLFIIILFSGCQAEVLAKKQVCLKDSCFTMEVAETPNQQAKGLMYRQSLGEKEGMLFVFSKPDLHGMWMKNMNFSLDMIWLNSSYEITEMRENIAPCQSINCSSYGTVSASMYVLEFPAGTIKKIGLKIGDKINLK